MGELDEPDEPDDRTDPDFRPPPVDEVAPARSPRQVFDLKEGSRVPATSVPKDLSLPSPKPPPAQSLRLPTPPIAAGRPPPSAPIALEGGEVFSSDALLDKLGVDESTKSPAAAHGPSIWRDREMRRAVGAALVIVLAFVAYRSLYDDEASPAEGETSAQVEAPKTDKVDKAGPAQKTQPVVRAEPATPPNPATLAGGPSQGAAVAPTPSPSPAPPVAEAPETKPTVYPMLSVMTTPPGAQIMVNGLVRGDSPLVMRSPSPDKELRIRITKKRFKTWEQVVRLNETGHFVVRAVLEDR